MLAGMTIWAAVGATSLKVHVISFVGGTVGGVVGGVLCESAQFTVTLLGHLAGAGAGAASLVGIARLAPKL